jgi:EmrB/QacA subfamily drug resistance transporter
MASPSSPTATPAHAGRWEPRLWGALIVLCGVLFLDGLDVSMVGVALPSIRADLGISTSDLQWVVSGYVLGYGGLLLLGGRVADILGRRRVLLVALAVFTLASLAGGLASDATLLIGARFVKGMAAAFTAPASLSLITTTFPEGPARNRALSIYTAVGASGFTSGLILGGLLTELGWRWTFLVPVPVALVVLLAAPRYIRRDPPAMSARGRFDIAGAVSVTAAMLLLVRAVVDAPNKGWTAPLTIGSFVASAVLLVLFVAIERRTSEPLLRLGILRNSHIVRANLGAMAVAGCYFGFQFMATLFLQSQLGWSALGTALAFLPAGLIVASGSPRMGALVTRFGPARVIAAGFAAFVAGYALFLPIGHSPVYVLAILPTILLVGTGFALSFGPLQMQATMGVGDHEQGLASGLVQTAFQVGGAVVLAVVSAIVSSQASGGNFLAAVHPAIAVITGVAALGLIAVGSGVASERRQQAALAEA